MNDVCNWRGRGDWEVIKNWSKLPMYITKKLPTGGGQKSGKIVDVVYGWYIIANTVGVACISQ